MTIFDDIRKDREAGTPGPWGISGATNVWVTAGTLHVATIPRAADGDWSPSNARRIARVPRLERAILDHADWLMHEIKVCEAAGDAIGVRAYRRTLAAFRAACVEGK